MIHASQLRSLRRIAVDMGRRDVYEKCLHTSAKPLTVSLLDLNADIFRSKRLLIFDCPRCCCEKAHSIRVQVEWWDEGASVYDLSLDCVVESAACGWRGRVERGQVISI